MKPERVYQNGDIVYWCHLNRDGRYIVEWGMVDQQSGDIVYVDYLQQRENRYVNDIPIDDFKSEEGYRKLPKGWTYDTHLYAITTKPREEDEYMKTLDLKNPADLKSAYDKGYLVKREKIFTGNIEADITKQGYRIIKSYPMWHNPKPNYVSALCHKVYPTYEEALAEVNANIAELHRQAELSDYDWSVEQIDKELDRWQKIYGHTTELKNQYREWILALDDVEDIEVRVSLGEIQWKYVKNKKWRNIEL